MPLVPHLMYCYHYIYYTNNCQRLFGIYGSDHTVGPIGSGLYSDTYEPADKSEVKDGEIYHGARRRYNKQQMYPI